MSDLAEQSIGTAYYRSRDSIKNFKIRVTLERVTSASIVPQAVIEQEIGGNVEMRDLHLKQNFGGQKDIETYTFKWQQKVYSNREVHYLYKNIEDCTNVLQEKHHQETELFRQKGKPTKRLFTYTAYESFTNTDENFQKVTDDPDERPTVMAEKMANLRHRGTGSKLREGNRLVPRLNVINYKPSEDLIKQNHYVSTAVQTMYIMADLSAKDTEPLTEDEHVLCTIRIDGNGVLSVRPDFNKSRKPYKIETSGIGREVFEYTLEHASEQLSRLEQEKESKIYKEVLILSLLLNTDTVISKLCRHESIELHVCEMEIYCRYLPILQLYGRHADYLQALVGQEFEIPPLEAIRILGYGEIVSGRNFENDNLYVTYFLELPQYWHSGMGHRLSGLTQICRTKTDGRDNVAYFSYPFNFELFYKNDSIDEKSKTESLPKLPLMYLEVSSLDSWERYRLEGYGYTAIPSTPGKHSVHVNCWRPVGRSCINEMRRYFVGGTPELEDPTYTAVPSTFDGKHLSKYGFRTVSTGSLTLNFNMIHQSQEFLHTAASKKKKVPTATLR